MQPRKSSRSSRAPGTRASVLARLSSSLDNAWVVIDGAPVQSVTGGGHWGGGMFINAYDMARFGQTNETESVGSVGALIARPPNPLR